MALFIFMVGEALGLYVLEHFIDILLSAIIIMSTWIILILLERRFKKFKKI